MIQKDHGLRAQCREHLPYAASRHHRAPAAQDAFREGDPADCLLRAVGHVGDQLLHLDLHGAYDAEISFVFFRIRHVIYLLSVLICSHYTRFSAGCQGVAAVLLPVLFPARELTFFVACLPCLWFLILPPIPPAPFPGGEGGDQGYFHARGFAPCIPGAGWDTALALLVENRFLRLRMERWHPPGAGTRIAKSRYRCASVWQEL